MDGRVNALIGRKKYKVQHARIKVKTNESDMILNQHFASDSYKKVYTHVKQKEMNMEKRSKI